MLTFKGWFIGTLHLAIAYSKPIELLYGKQARSDQPMSQTVKVNLGQIN